MTTSRIRDLNGTKDSWSIQARVCRLWKAADFKNNKDVFALEMVFVDEQGDSIQGYVRKNHMTRFKPLLKEGEVYTVRNFKVGKASPQYRVVANENRIYFNVTTSVRATATLNNNIPSHAFSFVPGDILDDRVGNNTILTYIIGCVVAAGPIEIVSTGPRREIELKNNRIGLMKVTLWGNLPSMFNLEPYDVTSTPVIAIVTSLTIRKFKGEFSFSSTTATKLYFNLALPEVTALSQTFSAGYEGVKDLQRPDGNATTVAEQATANRITIQELLAMEWVPGIEEHVRTFVGEIVEINQRYGWCYISCNHCSKKVVPTNGSFLCTPCKKPCAYPVIRYKIHVRAKDSTASTTLVIFNDDVVRFVKVPANTFMDRIGNGASDLPHEISNSLIGKTFIFKVKVTDYNLKDGFENYTVTRLFEPDVPDHKRKLEAGTSATHGSTSTVIDTPMPSGQTPIPPITPQKEMSNSKKTKLEE